jgi:hypothetical protein
VKFSDFEAQARRLALLQALHAAAGYRANARLLRQFVQRVGYSALGSEVLRDLEYLRDAELLTLDETAGQLVAELTERGQDVATGAEVAEGVDRPRAGAPKN